MLSTLLNLPRRKKSSSASPSSGPPSVAFGNAVQVMDQEEDGFLLVGQSASERSTVMPTAVQNRGATMLPPPPSYAQVTGTPSLPPASINTSYHSYSSPQGANTLPPPPQQHQVQHTGNSLRTPNAANSSFNTSSGLTTKSSSINWGIVDMPFQLSSVLSQTNRPMTDFYVAHLHDVDWRQYEYDFQFDLNVKRESELALEMMEDDYGGNGQSSDNSQENSEKIPF